MQVVGVIPAHLQSTRLPRKLLLSFEGKPLLQYTWESVCRSKSLDQVMIATDSEEIAEVARGFGGHVEMTGRHPSGTDRIAEVARRCCRSARIVVNVQGDEPEIDPAHIDCVVRALDASGSDMATLATPIATRMELDDVACTKVVCAADGRALYFSRAAIPHARDQNPDQLLPGESPWLLHVGLYAFRFDFLMELTRLLPTQLERLEKLEQLRALEAGAHVHVAVVEHRAVGIDTPDDYARFVARQSKCPDGRLKRAG